MQHQNKKLHVAPLYHTNLTYDRQMDIYRLTFLMGGRCAMAATVKKFGFHCTPDSLGVPRLYSNSWKTIDAATMVWMGQNQRGK